MGDEQVVEEDLLELAQLLDEDGSIDPRQFAARLSDALDDWAGVPVPLSGFAMTLEPRYPNRRELEVALDLSGRSPGDVQIDQLSPNAPTGEGKHRIRNVWYSRQRSAYIYLYDIDGDGKVGVAYKFKHTYVKRFDFWLQTLGASRAWDIDAELTAQIKLSEMIEPHQMDYYMLTGTFLEQSTRSNLLYMLRRLRPTVAITSLHPWEENSPLKVLATLCLHPVGYYQDTWGGAMVPTDDVIAHLMMIRGDEHLYWRRANQHDPDSPEAGL